MILTKVRLPSLFSIFLPLSPSSTADPFHLSQQFGKSAFLAKMKLETLREMGATLSPFATAQLLQGLETLSLRMDKHSSNALALAEYLEQHPAIAWVSRTSFLPPFFSRRN
jgi:O-acetylhomoserine/O-acetylserine sulfhydrylase-like pyridoxal-dependent enzyme